MKKFLLGTVTGVVLSAGGVAHAADLRPVLKAPPPPPQSWWEVETGTRVWFSNGNIGAPNPLFNNGGNVVSRLLYKDEKAISGELFGRLDHSSGLFVKGNAGLGRITSGNMYDEDFPAGGAYSNTLQNDNKGHLAYGTIDVGYNFLTAPGAKVGAFAGYNYYLQHVDTFGCVQLAGANACTPGTFPAFFNGISEDNSFSSLRIGLSGQFRLTDRLKLTADVAYLPWVNFQGVDNHNARSLIINEFFIPWRRCTDRGVAELRCDGLDRGRRWWPLLDLEYERGQHSIQFHSAANAIYGACEVQHRTLWRVHAGFVSLG